MTDFVDWEIGSDPRFIVSWPYLPEALIPYNQCDGVSQVGLGWDRMGFGGWFSQGGFTY